MCELSELAGIRKTDLERLKSFITRGDDGQVRHAYARSAVPTPRRCVFVGSTNEEECLPNDPSGNRRFVVVALEHGCNVEEAAAADRCQWWAEALARYREGVRANLPRGLRLLAADRAEEHRNRDCLEQDIEHALEDLPAQFSLNELFVLLPGYGGGRTPDRAMQLRLGNALKQLGFTSERRREGGAQVRLWSRR